MKGMTIYRWRDRSPQFDEVSWIPGTVDETDARALALLKLQADLHNTRVQINLGYRVINVSRTSLGDILLFE
jgi:hypothetical protein